MRCASLMALLELRSVLLRAAHPTPRACNCVQHPEVDSRLVDAEDYRAPLISNGCQTPLLDNIKLIALTISTNLG